LADATYLPTVGYIIKEDEDTHTVIGATAYVTAPTGNYSTSQLVNLSDHRWRIEPQLVVSQRFLKVMTAELLGNLTFYTDNKDFPIPAATGLTTVTAQQALTFGLEGHVAADLSKTFYVAGAYYLAAAGKRNLVVPGAGSVPLDDAQTVQSLRFTYGIHIEKQSLLLLQYHQDIEASGGATISRFFGVRMSHVFF
jgi:hypothetical protein